MTAIWDSAMHAWQDDSKANRNLSTRIKNRMKQIQGFPKTWWSLLGLFVLMMLATPQISFAQTCNPGTVAVTLNGPSSVLSWQPFYVNWNSTAPSTGSCTLSYSSTNQVQALQYLSPTPWGGTVGASGSMELYLSSPPVGTTSGSATLYATCGGGGPTVGSGCGSITIQVTAYPTVTPTPTPTPKPTSPPATGNIWFVVGASGANMSADDQVMLTHLTNLGYGVNSVYWGGTTTPPNLAGIKLVVLSSTSDPAGDAAFVGEGVPILVYKASAFPNLNMTKPPANAFWGNATGQTQVSIQNPSSPLAAGLSGTVTVTGAPASFAWGAPNSSAIAVASLAGSPGYDTIFAYPKSSSMIYGYTAPACRVGFFFGDGGPSTATAAAWQLFDAAASWLTTPACE